MKAKEYAQILIDGNYDIDSVSKVVQGLLGEISSISKARNITSVSRMNAVVQEIRQKWKAIYRRTNGLNEDGFDRFLKEKGFVDEDYKLNEVLLRIKYDM